MALESTNMESFVKSLLEELKQMASTDTVVGKPIEIEDTTVLPVIKFTVGFGAGGGEGTGETPGSKQSKTGTGTGYGQGGGGGIKVDPVAFITVHDGRAALLPVSKRGSGIERLIESVPDIVERIQAVQEKKEQKS